MSAKSQNPFVYGTFLTFLPQLGMTPPPPPVEEGPDFAIEILREFNPSEFVGKLYTRARGNWSLFPADALRKAFWFETFSKARTHIVFDMQGSGAWEILHFRIESDEGGTYVAVALRYVAQTPSWVEGARDRLKKRGFGRLGS